MAATTRSKVPKAAKQETGTEGATSAKTALKRTRANTATEATEANSKLLKPAAKKPKVNVSTLFTKAFLTL